LLIVDNRIAFTGGVGIASEWEGDANGPDEWRDTHFKIQGPAVLGLRAAFLSDWRDCGHPIDTSALELTEPVAEGDVQLG
jgi:cardiolipin synthase